MRAQWLQTAPWVGWATYWKMWQTGWASRVVKESKKKSDTNILGPKNARLNSIWLVEVKGKGGWAKGRAVENRHRETRLQIEKRGNEGRKEWTPAPSMKKSDTTYQPFCSDVPRDPKSGRWDGPRGTAWQIGWGLRSGFDGTGLLSRPFPWEGSTGWISCPSGPRGARSTAPALAKISPCWIAWLDKAEWTTTRRAACFTELIGGEASRGDNVTKRNL